MLLQIDKFDARDLSALSLLERDFQRHIDVSQIFHISAARGDGLEDLKAYLLSQ